MSEVSFGNEDFGALLEESLSNFNIVEGTVVHGTIVNLEKDAVVVDVGLKVEGRVPKREFGSNVQDSDFKVGEKVEVYLERVENAVGEAVLSREKARREESWKQLEKAFKAEEKVTGLIYSQVKGGFTVDIDGVGAFLPRSQVDIRPIHDVSILMNTPQPFHILKMDRHRGNIVVSRRMVLEETRAVQRSELIDSLKEEQVLEGVVKNITDYGAFVDLGGIDGLLHVTDIAWRRIVNPSEVLNISDIVKVKVIRINQETQRISLGMKQLEPDPWLNIEEKYPLRAKVTGRITNIADYGAFVELEEGIEGLIHVSEMSWTKKNVHPSKIVSTSQEVEVVVLDIDMAKRRISLGLKQTLENPWESFAENNEVGSRVEGAVKNKTEFGLFIGLGSDIDGMIHLSDLSWDRTGDEALEEYTKGQVVEAIVLDVDVKKERVSLGIKQLVDDPYDKVGRRGDVVTCEVVDIKEGGLDVKIVDMEVFGFVRRAELSIDKAEQRSDRFSLGDKFDARITQIDKKARKIQLSVKALEMAEEKEAIEQYGSSDAGAALGDILGAALKAKDDGEDSKKSAKSEKETKAKATKADKSSKEKSDAAEDASKADESKVSDEKAKAAKSKKKDAADDSPKEEKTDKAKKAKSAKSAKDDKSEDVDKSEKPAKSKASKTNEDIKSDDSTDSDKSKEEDSAKNKKKAESKDSDKSAESEDGNKSEAPESAEEVEAKE